MIGVEELKSTCLQEKYYIYGNGNVGTRLLKCFREFGYDKCFLGFIVSGYIEDSSTENVYSVFDISLDKGAIVLIAVHDIYVDEIVENIKKVGFKRWEWIYPVMFELEHGIPEKTDVQVSVKLLVSKMDFVYMLAVYFLTIDEVCGNNTIGIRCHERMLSQETNMITAQKRTKAFCDSIKERGNNHSYSHIKVNQDMNYCFDGNHRMMTAYYFKERFVFCDLYRANEARKSAMRPIFGKTEKEVFETHAEGEAILITNTMRKLKKANDE
ncbi:hypothetical protein [Butyrivibrio sp. AE2032]|uniref:hypothetical protein n=1 Tax=Butyrivibrio sp. AE2032 TaxID=1458463 RepID=UPI00054D3908|nr:hypothetical protein [Butyrivibrio sp. AE2032]